jgi:hypothetical protein
MSENTTSNPNERVRRAIRTLGKSICLAMVRALQERRLRRNSRNRKNSTMRRNRRPPAPDIYVALFALGYHDLHRERTLASAKGFALLAARLRVDYGDSAMQMLYFWFHLERLLWGIRNGAVTEHPLSFIDGCAQRLGIADRINPTIDALAKLADSSGGLNDNITLANEIVAAKLIPEIEHCLGLEEYLRSDNVEGAAITYPRLYRYCKRLGELRALWAAGRVTNIADHDRLRSGFELWTILERLNVLASIPTELQHVHRILVKLKSWPDKVPRPFELALWGMIDRYLAIMFGGCASRVFMLATHIDMFYHFSHVSDQIRDDLIRMLRHIEDGSTVIGPIGISFTKVRHVLEDEEIGREQRAQILEGFSYLADDWLTKRLPSEHNVELSHARIVVWTETFRQFWLPIEPARIEAFIRQFPHDMRWLGEDLIDAVEFYDERFFSNALSSVLRNREGANEDISICLLGGARKSSSLMSYILDRKLGVKVKELHDALTIKDVGRTILFIDDCMLTGTQAIHIFSELLGIWRRHPYKYFDEPLTKRRINALRKTRIEIVTAIGTRAAAWRVQEFFAKLDISCGIEFGDTVPWLSERGFEDLKRDSLLDSGGSLREPTVQLANPIFGPSARLHRSGDWRAAQELCGNIGRQLLSTYGPAQRWQPERLLGSSLGFSGFQGRLVFSHNVPKTTLTLLWCSGTYDGRPWMPLFPSRG